MKPEKMTVICNIQAMQRHIKAVYPTYRIWDFTGLEKLTIDELRNIQYSEVIEYNSAVNKDKTLT